LCQDAAELVVPPGPVLIFLFNSFGGTTLRMVLERLEKSYGADPRPLLLAYYNPVHADVVETRELFRRTAEGKDWAVYTVGVVGR
jgi:hypothetical protein